MKENVPRLHFDAPIYRRTTSPSKLIINEHEITNDKDIADQLNKFFSNTGINLASIVPKPNLPFNCYLDKPQASSFFSYHLQLQFNRD